MKISDYGHDATQDNLEFASEKDEFRYFAERIPYTQLDAIIDERDKKIKPDSICK